MLDDPGGHAIVKPHCPSTSWSSKWTLVSPIPSTSSARPLGDSREPLPAGARAEGAAKLASLVDATPDGSSRTVVMISRARRSLGAGGCVPMTCGATTKVAPGA